MHDRVRQAAESDIKSSPTYCPPNLHSCGMQPCTWRPQAEVCLKLGSLFRERQVYSYVADDCSRTHEENSQEAFRFSHPLSFSPKPASGTEIKDGRISTTSDFARVTAAASCRVEHICLTMSATATTTASGSLPSEVTAATLLLGAGDTSSSTSQYGTLQLHQEHHHDRPLTTNNPEWWPTQHRRIPDYRRARYNPQWYSLTDSSREAFMINMMFRGCYLLNVGRNCLRSDCLSWLIAPGCRLDPQGVRL